MMKFALTLGLILTGCAPVGFEFRPAGADQTLHVGSDAQSQFDASPLHYRLLSDEGHLILWIDNPTDQPIQLVGVKSSVEDPTGDMHYLHGRTIDPHSSIKEVFPPLPEDEESPEAQAPPPPIPQPGNPYDQPGFLTIPGTGGGVEPPTWKWDDGLEIRLDLLFQQGPHSFEQHFVIRKVRK